MTSHRPPTIVLWSTPGTLEGIDAPLRRAGVRLVRLTSSTPQPVDPTLWLERLAHVPKPDTVVVTSRAAVGAGVRPWRRAGGPFPASLEFWAVGPGSEKELRRAGVRRVHRPRAIGSAAVAESLVRSPPRSVVYFRSDLAGSGLARSLRSQGHRVTDLVVYRTDAAPRLTARAGHELAGAKLLVVTSPSGLSDLRRRLDRPTFTRVSRTTRLVVLGERSCRAARGHGFRLTSVAPSTTAQRFTRHLLRELRDAGT